MSQTCNFYRFGNIFKKGTKNNNVINIFRRDSSPLCCNGAFYNAEEALRGTRCCRGIYISSHIYICKDATSHFEKNWKGVLVLIPESYGLKIIFVEGSAVEVEGNNIQNEVACDLILN